MMGEPVSIAARKISIILSFGRTGGHTVFHDFADEDANLNSCYNVNYPGYLPTEPPFLRWRRWAWSKATALVLLGFC